MRRPVVLAFADVMAVPSPVPPAVASQPTPPPRGEAGNAQLTISDQARDNGPGSICSMVIDVPASRVGDLRARKYLIDSLKPGSTIRRRLEVSNTSSKPQHVELYAAAASVENNRFTAVDGRQSNDLTSWVSLESASLDLKAKTRKPVWLTLSVPKTAPAGERYAAIFAEVSQPPTEGGGVIQVNRVGVRMYLDVGPGGEPPTAFKIDNITVHRDPDQWPVVTALVHNTGGRAIDMVGQLSLSNGDGAIKAGPFKVTTGVTILPGNSGEVMALLDKPLPPGGDWDIEFTLVSGTLEHTATAKLNVPGPQSSRQWWQSVFAIAGAAALVFIGAVLLLVRYLLRRRRRLTLP